MTYDFTAYITIGILVFALHRIRRAIRARNSVTASLKGLTVLCEILLIATAIFYWRITSSTTLSTFDSWTTAIDIAFAHVFVTMIVFFVFYYLLNSISILLSFLILAIAFIVDRVLLFIFVAPAYGVTYLVSKSNAQKVADVISAPIQTIFAFFLLNRDEVVTLIKVTGSFLITKLLLIDTIDLQEYYLFGSYDGTLGWYLPTTYRFTILFNHVNEIFVFLSSNDVIRTTIGFLALLIGGIIGVAGLLKAVKDISESFKR